MAESAGRVQVSKAYIENGFDIFYKSTMIQASSLHNLSNSFPVFSHQPHAAIFKVFFWYFVLVVFYWAMIPS